MHAANVKKPAKVPRLNIIIIIIIIIIITCRQKCCVKGRGKEVKIQEFMYRDTANVEPEMYDHTSNNWSHWDSNEKL